MKYYGIYEKSFNTLKAMGLIHVNMNLINMIHYYYIREFVSKVQNNWPRVNSPCSHYCIW